MKIIYVICEGQTEAKFVNNILSAHFDFAEYAFIPEIVLTKMDRKTGKVYKGGISSFSKVEKNILHSLGFLSKKDAFLTTMIDFYALPADTPGYVEASSECDIYKKADIIEKSIKEKICDNPRFFPYIQLHEFETLLFSDLSKLQEVYFEYADDMQPLYDAVNKFENIEIIDGGADTSPSKRIISCISHYDKTVLGIEALSKIEFEKIRKSCQHFNEWILKMELL